MRTAWRALQCSTRTPSWPPGSSVDLKEDDKNKCTLTLKISKVPVSNKSSTSSTCFRRWTWGQLLRIRIRNILGNRIGTDPHHFRKPDPHRREKPDLEPVYIQKADPDPHHS
jgi:hypothetical protein